VYMLGLVCVNSFLGRTKGHRRTEIYAGYSSQRMIGSRTVVQGGVVLLSPPNGLRLGPTKSGGRRVVHERK
jgi:hypothetical protein